MPCPCDGGPGGCNARGECVSSDARRTRVLTALYMPPGLGWFAFGVYGGSWSPVPVVGAPPGTYPWFAFALALPLGLGCPHPKPPSLPTPPPVNPPVLPPNMGPPPRRRRRRAMTQQTTRSERTTKPARMRSLSFLFPPTAESGTHR